MTRATLVRALVFALVGALVSGVIGYLRAYQDFPTYQATLQMRIEPDPPVGAAADGSEVDQATFLASELVVLNGPELRDSLDEVLPEDVDVAVRTQQVGSTSVVVVAATASSKEEAQAGADAVAARYAGRRRTALLNRISTTQNEIERQVRETSAQIEELAGGEGVTSAIQRTALAAEFSRLIELQRNLLLARSASGRLVTVVKPADVGGVPQLVRPKRSAAIGAVLGAAIGLTAALALARVRRRISGLDELLELTPELALPTLPQLRGRGLDHQAGRAAASHVSALTPAAGQFAEPALVVIAPRPGAGATFCAVGLAVASARRRPTMLIAAADALDGAAARMLGLDEAFLRTHPIGTPVPTAHERLHYLRPVNGTGAGALVELELRIAEGLLAATRRTGVSVVVDAPALSHSSAGLDLARKAGQALLVGGVEHTRADELEAAATAVRRVGAKVVGVVLSSPPDGLLSRWRARS